MTPKIIVEVRRGMVECVYTDMPDIQVFVLDHDAQAQGYGDEGIEQAEVCPLSAGPDLALFLP
jgi:hypothetical protein